MASDFEDRNLVAWRVEQGQQDPANPRLPWKRAAHASDQDVLLIGLVPDGKNIAFSSDMDESGAFNIYTIPAEGGEPARMELTQSAWPQQIM